MPESVTSHPMSSGEANKIGASVREGGTSFLAHCYGDYLTDIRQFLARQLGCRETARDLAQETYLRLLGMLGERLAPAEIGNPRALLYRIAGNLATDHVRHARTRGESPLTEEEERQLACPLPGPEQIVMARRTLERLCREIDRLPPRCRSVFLMAKFDGLPQAEIATKLNISRNAVEKHLIRALLQLGRQLDGNDASI